MTVELELIPVTQCSIVSKNIVVGIRSFSNTLVGDECGIQQVTDKEL